MIIKPSDYLIDIIEKNPYTLLVIEHLQKFDYPKNVTIKEFCKDTQVPEDLLIILLNTYTNLSYTQNFCCNRELLPWLVNFLKNSHSYYKNEKYPLINNLLSELNKSINTNEAKLLSKFFHNYFNEVIEHLDYEEKIVFPYINELLNGKNKSKLIFSSEEYLEHHNDIEEKLSDLKNLLLHHFKFEKYYNLGRQLIFHLFELEFDLKAHSKLEENLLVPSIKKLELNTK